MHQLAASDLSGRRAHAQEQHYTPRHSREFSCLKSTPQGLISVVSRNGSVPQDLISAVSRSGSVSQDLTKLPVIPVEVLLICVQCQFRILDMTQISG